MDKVQRSIISEHFVDVCMLVKILILAKILLLFFSLVYNVALIISFISYYQMLVYRHLKSLQFSGKSIVGRRRIFVYNGVQKTRRDDVIY